MVIIRFADLFAGIGGFRLGIRQAAEKTGSHVQCVFSSEIEKNARVIYGKNFEDEPAGDVTKIPADSIPDIDILCGGFPCQSFSIAGKRKGFEDTRGTLFFEIARICKEKRPTIVFLENVKGLLSHDRGRTFGVVLSILDELGYDAEWQVLNSKNHGVPQNRERVFIIGHLRRSQESRFQVFPIGKVSGVRTESTQSEEEVCKCAGTLTARQYASWNGNFIKSVRPILALNRGKKRQNGRRIKESGEPMFTLTAQDQHGVLIAGVTRQNRDNTPSKDLIRRLTPIECERLQGFPDCWTEGVSDTARYKCLGNAVTVNVIEVIAERILKGMIK